MNGDMQVKPATSPISGQESKYQGAVDRAFAEVDRIEEVVKHLEQRLDTFLHPSGPEPAETRSPINPPQAPAVSIIHGHTDRLAEIRGRLISLLSRLAI